MKRCTSKPCMYPCMQILHMWRHGRRMSIKNLRKMKGERFYCKIVDLWARGILYLEIQATCKCVQGPNNSQQDTTPSNRRQNFIFTFSVRVVSLYNMWKITAECTCQTNHGEVNPGERQGHKSV